MDLNQFKKNALDKLQKDFSLFEDTIAWCKENRPNIYAFIERVLSWHPDKSKHVELWVFLNNVVDLNDLNFIGSFRSFVANGLLDDSMWSIRWSKPNQDSNNPDVLFIESSTNDILAEPEVVWDQINGGQNVNLLMEAMDHIERCIEERNKLYQEFLSDKD